MSSMLGCLGWLCLVAGLARAATDQNLVPLIVLKNPRSGSSWLVQLLNSVPSAFVKDSESKCDEGQFDNTDLKISTDRAAEALSVDSIGMSLTRV